MQRGRWGMNIIRRRAEQSPIVNSQRRKNFMNVDVFWAVLQAAGLGLLFLWPVTLCVLVVVRSRAELDPEERQEIEKCKLKNAKCKMPSVAEWQTFRMLAVDRTHQSTFWFLLPPQCSNGVTQSRPSPARAVKIMASARHLTQKSGAGGVEPVGISALDKIEKPTRTSLDFFLTGRPHLFSNGRAL